MNSTTFMKLYPVPIFLLVAVGLSTGNADTTNGEESAPSRSSLVQELQHQPEPLPSREIRSHSLPVNIEALKDPEVLVRRDGAWQPDPERAREAQDRLTVRFEEDELQIIRDRERAKIPRLSEEKQYLSGRVIRARRSPAPAVRAFDPPGEEQPDSDDVLEIDEAMLFIRASALPLQWDCQREAYVTNLVIGLEASQEEIELDEESAISVWFFPSDSSVEPATVDLVASGVRGYREVTLLCPAASHHPRVTVKSDLGEVEFEVIEHEQRAGRLVISQPEDRIFGFGLGKTQIRVRSRTNDGRSALPVEQDLRIDLTARGGGKFEPGRGIVIPAGDSYGDVRLRSHGIGPRTITASADDRFDACTSMYFAFPLAFLIAALLGGTAGGSLRSFRQKKKAEPKWIPLIIEGCVVGLVAVTAVTAGFVVADVPLPALGTEVGAFVVAAIAGYIGAVFMDRIASAVFRKAD